MRIGGKLAALLLGTAPAVEDSFNYSVMYKFEKNQVIFFFSFCIQIATAYLLSSFFNYHLESNRESQLITQC